MKDFSAPMYQDMLQWVKTQREHNQPWDKIYLARKNSKEELEMFLRNKEDEEFWPHFTVEEWEELVNFMKKTEEERETVQLTSQNSITISDGENNNAVLPRLEGSCWCNYKKKLLKEKGFNKTIVEQIEKTNYDIVKKLSGDTRDTDPVKGLVLGNVQSGKTANMAALMAMAADNGWNMFIILSGTIDSLRRQTQERLFEDLSYEGNLQWVQLEHPSKKSSQGSRLQDLYLKMNSKTRYMTVCLKNEMRLKNLIQWLKQDPNNYSNLKIVIIDDEADQAGIDTSDITAENRERKAVNKRIVELISGLDEKNQKLPTKCLAMNYIGYTATPYANILNEGPDLESLYPSKFITTLDVSKEYFGPQQIFGCQNDENVDFPGLDIVREISKDEVIHIKEGARSSYLTMPYSLERALCWFLCCVSIMRKWNRNKPVSMLIHTSQKTDEHQVISDTVDRWFQTNSIEKIIEKCEKVYNYETSRFGLATFREQYEIYDRENSQIREYPLFSDLKPILKFILSQGLTHIKLDEEDDFCYSEGIHLCVDNCKNNGVNSEGMHVRLAYPNTDLGYASAFIVVGGATLSRGLTIEGLVSTYFLRTVKQADTLMQMGRWFGYRKNYELLPRIWMTANTRMQFDFLSLLDQELRNEIYEMDIKKISPKEYGPRVCQHPKVSFLRITAKNKMQSASTIRVNYCNSYNQTYLFDDDETVLNTNIVATRKFVEMLGPSNTMNINNPFAGKNKIWTNVDYKKVHKYLKEYKFQNKLIAFSDIDGLCDWVEKCIKQNKLSNWNVIFASPLKEDADKEWKVGNEVVYKVDRTRKCGQPKEDDFYYKNHIINIGALRDPRDLISDVNFDLLDPNIAKKLAKHDWKGISMTIQRDQVLGTVPQLIIYCINKDSKTRKGSTTRQDLKSKVDIIGLCIGIPGGKNNENYAEKVSIKLNRDFMDIDVEG